VLSGAAVVSSGDDVLSSSDLRSVPQEQRNHVWWLRPLTWKRERAGLHPIWSRNTGLWLKPGSED